MNKPMFTDRTKLYIGMYSYFESGTHTLAPTIDNTDEHLKIYHARCWPLIADNNSVVVNYNSTIKPISGPLTQSKLAEIIRPTKVEGYTHFLLADRTFIWAQSTPDGFCASNGRLLKPEPLRPTYCNKALEWFADWREALPLLMKRLNKRLQEMRNIGKIWRLEYAEFINSQRAINEAQAIEIRNNNKRFKGIPF